MNVYWPQHKQHVTQIWATALVELALSRGAQLEPLLRGTGLFKQDLTNSNHQCSSEQFAQLIKNSLKHTDSLDLSFMLGRRLFSIQSNCFTQIIEHAKNLRQAAMYFQLYQRDIFPFAFASVNFHNDDVYLILNPATKATEQQFMFEVLCSLIYHTSKRICGRLVPYSFSFEIARPRNIYQFEENLGRRVTFSQPLSWIKIERSYLKWAVQESSAFTRKSLSQQCRQHAKCNNKVSAIQFLHQAIAKGRISNLEQAAELLDMSVATLKRKLKTADIGFQQLQDSVRKQQAIFELVVCNQNNGAVARKLQFNDVTNFRRAFKRWTGITPAQLKAD